MISIWGHILEEPTHGGLEMEILSEDLPSLPISRATSSHWIGTMGRGHLRSLSSGELRGPQNCFLPTTPSCWGDVDPPHTTPGWLPVWKEIGDLSPWGVPTGLRFSQISWSNCSPILEMENQKPVGVLGGCLRSWAGDRD